MIFLLIKISHVLLRDIFRVKKSQIHQKGSEPPVRNWFKFRALQQEGYKPKTLIGGKGKAGRGFVKDRYWVMSITSMTVSLPDFLDRLENCAKIVTLRC